MEWTPTADHRLTVLWATKASTSEIGDRMGCTKNSITGRAHRIHLPPRLSPIIKEGKARYYRSTIAQRAAVDQTVIAIPAVIMPTTRATDGNHSVPLNKYAAQRTAVRGPTLAPSIAAEAAAKADILRGKLPPRPDADGCRYIAGDPRQKAPYCDAPVWSGGSYCAAHRAVCYARVRVGEAA